MGTRPVLSDLGSAGPWQGWQRAGMTQPLATLGESEVWVLVSSEGTGLLSSRLVAGTPPIGPPASVTGAA